MSDPLAQDEDGEELDEKGRTVQALLSRSPTTAPVDPRFPNQNQNKYCYALYTKFKRCQNAHDGDAGAAECFTLKRWTHDLCPKECVTAQFRRVFSTRFVLNMLHAYGALEFLTENELYETPPQMGRELGRADGAGCLPCPQGHVLRTGTSIAETELN